MLFFLGAPINCNPILNFTIEFHEQKHCFGCELINEKCVIRELNQVECPVDYGFESFIFYGAPYIIDLWIISSAFSMAFIFNKKGFVSDKVWILILFLTCFLSADFIMNMPGMFADYNDFNNLRIKSIEGFCLLIFSYLGFWFVLCLVFMAKIIERPGRDLNLRPTD